MAAKKLDDKLLTEFIDTFYGYGEYSAIYWFVGIEEHGGKSRDDVEKRLAAWKKRGKQRVESDIAAYHREIGKGNLFEEKPKYQPTWHKLIRLYFEVNDFSPDKSALQDYQRKELARDGCICWLELLSLPSPSTKEWQYYKYSSLTYLRKRKLYEKEVLPTRIEHLQKKIKKHKPKMVLFYGTMRKESWAKIAKAKFKKDKIRDLEWAKIEETLFLIIKHPSTVGITNEYFQSVAKFIAERTR